MGGRRDLLSRLRAALAASLALLLGGPALARDSLGVFATWAAFRDSQSPRCYAIAMARDTPRAGAQQQAYADVAHWPRRGLRNQVHFRLSRTVVANTPLRLTVGSATFPLVAIGGDAWPADRRSDAAVVAAMRSADMMRVAGRGVSDAYPLAGAASAIDAAALGCARGA